MGAAVGLRGDYAAGQLRGLAKRSVDAAQTRRLLALAAIYEGGSRTEAAKIGRDLVGKLRSIALLFLVAAVVAIAGSAAAQDLSADERAQLEARKAALFQE